MNFWHSEIFLKFSVGFFLIPDYLFETNRKFLQMFVYVNEKLIEGFAFQMYGINVFSQPFGNSVSLIRKPIVFVIDPLSVVLMKWQMKRTLNLEKIQISPLFFNLGKWEGEGGIVRSNGRIKCKKKRANTQTNNYEKNGWLVGWLLSLIGIAWLTNEPPEKKFQIILGYIHHRFSKLSSNR